MKLPRDLSGADLAKALTTLGYAVTRQTGSHLRLSTLDGGEHHVTVPGHKAIPLSTLRLGREKAARLLLDRHDPPDGLQIMLRFSYPMTEYLDDFRRRAHIRPCLPGQRANRRCLPRCGSDRIGR